MRRVLHRHALSPLSDSPHNQYRKLRVGKAEYDPPICSDCYGPESLQLSFKRMQLKGRQIQIGSRFGMRPTSRKILRSFHRARPSPHAGHPLRRGVSAPWDESCGSRLTVMRYVTSYQVRQSHPVAVLRLAPTPARARLIPPDLRRLARHCSSAAAYHCMISAGGRSASSSRAIMRIGSSTCSKNIL